MTGQALTGPPAGFDCVLQIVRLHSSFFASTNYHQWRFAKLEREGLAAAGIDDAGERHTQREALSRLGYVWRPPNQQAPFRWHSGIPSLMAHVPKEAA